MNTPFSISYAPTHYDCDCHERMRPSAVLLKMQECAGYQLDSLGLPYDRLYEEGFVFVIVSVGMKFYELPRMEQAVTFETWPMAVKGARFHRNYRVLDGDRLLCEAASQWVLIDPHSRKILRPAAFPHPLPLVEQAVQVDLGARLCMPEDLQPLPDKLVRYSDVDANGHLNNVKYADIVMDYGPFDPFRQQAAELYLSMTGEAYPGQIIRLSGKREEETVFVRGEHDRGHCFDGILKIK